MRNRIKCSKCNNIIESRHQHDFKWCKCKTVFVDGGSAYWRCGGNLECIIRIYDDGREEPVAEIPLPWNQKQNGINNSVCSSEINTDSEPIDINDILFYNVRSN